MSIAGVASNRLLTVNSKIYSWCAVANNIIQGWQRQDDTVSAVADDGSGDCRLTIGDSSDLVVGHYLWFEPATVYTAGYYEIINKSDGTHVDIDLTYSASCVGYIVSIEDLKANYYLEIKLYLFGAALPFATLYGYSDKEGKIYVNLAPFLRSQLEKRNAYTYSGDYLEPYLALATHYLITYIEHWDSSAEGSASLTAESYILFAAMQLGAEYGENMVNHTPMDDGLILCDYLTGFVRPKKWIGYPMDFAMPVDDDWSGKGDMNFLQIQKDINGVDGSMSLVAWGSDANYKRLHRRAIYWGASDADLDHLLYLTWVAANAITNWNNGYTANNPTLDNLALGGDNWEIGDATESTGNNGYAVSDSIGAVVAGQKIVFWCASFTATGGIPRVHVCAVTTGLRISDIVYLPTGAGIEAYAVLTIETSNANARICIGYDGTRTGTFSGIMTAGFLVVDEKYIDFESCIPEQPVYLSWLNQYGGMDYWMFGGSQDEGLEVEGEFYDRYVDDLADDIAIQSTIQKRGLETMIMGADNLTSQQIDGLKWLLLSPFVQMHVSGTSGTVVWKTVVVRPDSWMLKRNKEKLFSLQFEIELPRLFVQS